MKRRDFLQSAIPAAAILPETINGFTLKAFHQNSPLIQALMKGEGLTDHVLVIVQLTGGNDGLNMVIPIGADYISYLNARSNIAIDENKVLTLNGVAKTGIHPAMTGLQTSFNDGKVNFIQAVGYPQPSFSHFRATDIWMSGSNSDQDLYTGWMGRYLGHEYPGFPNGFPNTNMPDPLAIQIGSTTSLTFQGPSVNMAMSITNPTSFYNLITGVTDPTPNTKAGKELSFVRLVNQQTQQYSNNVKAAANSVNQQGVYPSNNTLADQLKIVARLVKGGLKTRVYMVSYGGFDTHSSQVVNNDHTIGAHANLLKNISDAIKAFQDDIKTLGIEDRILGITFSEFGRRIKSNSSFGTDHGAAAPMIVFGSKILSGVLGVNPSIPSLATVNDNIPFQYDFRSVYATVLEKWFCLDRATVSALFPSNINAQLQSFPLIKAGSCSYISPGFTGTLRNYPNPFTTKTTIEFQTTGGHTLIQIIDMLGRVIAILLEKNYTAAQKDTVVFDGSNLSNGIYYARFQNGTASQVLPMMKIR